MIWENQKKMPSLTRIHPLVKIGFHLFQFIRQWLDNIEIQNQELAKLVCRLIPEQCPFERDVNIFGHTLFHIPPLCKFNPFSEQLIYLRFRALSYLANQCSESI